MLRELLLDVIKLIIVDNSSARRALLAFWHFVNDIASKLIFLDSSRHKPIPVQTFQVESVEAVLNTDQIRSLREENRPTFFAILVEIIEADWASSNEGIVILSEYLSDLFMTFIDETIIIFVLFSLIRKLLESTGYRLLL